MSNLFSLARLASDRSANVALTFGVVMPLAVGAGSFAVDTALRETQRSTLQEVAEAASRAGAAAFHDTRYITTTQRQDAALARARAAVANLGADLVPNVTVDPASRSVRVAIEEQARSGFTGMLAGDRADLGASSRAVAERIGGNVCVLALDPAAPVGIAFTGSAAFKAQGCALWSNAASDKAIAVGAEASLQADQACAAGGVFVAGGPDRLKGEHGESCGTLPDPLAGWSPSVSQACTARDTRMDETGDVILWPGTYCGGLEVSAGGRITLMPGDYHVKGGTLKLAAGGAIKGEDIGIWLSGRTTAAEITARKSVRLTARRLGELRGKVLAAEPRQAGSLVSRIAGASVDLVGTVHLPAQAFTLAGDSVDSPLQQIIAGSVELHGTTAVALAADFGKAGLPRVASVLPSVRLLR